MNNAEAPAFNPIAFEEEVRKAATPEKQIEFKVHLLWFIAHHAPGAKIAIGNRDCYDWRTGELMMTPETASGEGMRSLLTAAHECAHWQQQQEWPWLPWWVQKLPLVPLVFEVDGWRRALRMLT